MPGKTVFKPPEWAQKELHTSELAPGMQTLNSRGEVDETLRYVSKRGACLGFHFNDSLCYLPGTVTVFDRGTWETYQSYLLTLVNEGGSHDRSSAEG